MVNWLRSQNISFVERQNNAPNRPQVRSIEKYWALCKKEYKKSSRAQKFQWFQNNLAEYILKKVIEMSGKTLWNVFELSLDLLDSRSYGSIQVASNIAINM